MSQPKSKPAMLTPAHAIPAATVRPTLRATIDPARNEVYMLQMRRRENAGVYTSDEKGSKGRLYATILTMECVHRTNTLSSKRKQKPKE